MNLFSFARKPRRARTADTAKDRLQILLAHERSGTGTGEASYLPKLQKDIVAAIRKYVAIGDDDVEVRMERGDQMSSLEINIDLPQAEAGGKAEAAKSGSKAAAKA
ncbi:MULTISPECIES: cell division topological specificity factor MinE [unclassified Roseivivax]|uniref:cell division topological specificity factor MinE n=1 Tax=Roseivivax sp. GX 12232 TaxID=2900547 RepID=UPI001E390F48|nr:cell division topological specificity factor MinE [Roseivivax sp. GX 12232]MCE0505530.1 cell division topological specificity factor MinE [Roseivivax sp. GX 12232]